MRRIRISASALAMTVVAATLTVSGAAAVTSGAGPAPAPAPAPAAAPAPVAPAAPVVPISPSEVRDYAWFNTKAESQDMHAGVSGHVRRLIDAAPPGATLSLTLYFFNRQEVLDALRGAAARGVRVRIVINGSQVHDGDAYYKALKATPSIKVVECGRRRSDGQSTRGCMSDRSGASPLRNPPLMHNKFMTISSVRLAGGGTARNVLYVSSANLDHYTAYENALTVSHAGLYADYLTYFNALMRHGASGDVDDDYGRTAKAGAHRVLTFPRKEAAGGRPGGGSNDPIVDILTRTPCASTGRTRIDLANFRIQRTAVVKALKDARERGCRVRIVTGAVSGAPHDAGPPMRALVDLARAMPVHLCGYTPGGGIPMHEKFMIVRQGARSTLYVGSHNLTYRALRQNDENILALRDHALGGPFQQRFESHYRTCLPWKPRPNVTTTTNAADHEDTD
ncbi:phosphatidylserine/phosphatidylglycerophosphate/cardiolipin synthase family protein [Streptomyces sp. NPDC016309]|uniref:phospholipase D-like domain-containing protein n=1 Tax=Streptomyces sp. NPDC016309 TaxID=3364965 RepID=UPI0036FE69F6